MPTLTTVNLDCSLGEKSKNGVKSCGHKWQKMLSHQLSWPNVSCLKVTFKENDDCIKRAHSFNNINTVQEHAKYNENLKQQFEFLEKSEQHNCTGARRKTKNNGCIRKGSIIKRSKENRRRHSFNQKQFALKSVLKGTLTNFDRLTVVKHSIKCVT